MPSHNLGGPKAIQKVTELRLWTQASSGEDKPAGEREMGGGQGERGESDRYIERGGRMREKERRDSERETKRVRE